MSEQKVAVVTGASRGIGKAIAEELARQGHIVACVATRRENAEKTVEAIGGQAKAYGCDVSNAAQVLEVMTAIDDDFGTPTILVNNAGITRDTLLARMSDDDWQKVIDVNLTGTYNCIKALLRGMMKARWGRIVNITSVVGLHGAAGQVNYSASKAGLVGLTMSVARELGSRNITCNAVAPGFIETDMTSELSEEMRANVMASAPLGRLGTPEDIAGVVGFLTSDAAGYVTGQTITVDGGLTL
ncbi:MAG: 3-oxoacyl-[acyl-carrier-protein] reductase [Armatimonadetes bacterium]|nr:3-oxoacyl-[acyl-carrier-protein] reductase [Armatimonadota bacterium]